MFFFHREISELPRPIAIKLCHTIGNWPNFIMQVRKFGGGGSPKKLRVKNMQNFGRFYIASADFDREYLRKEQR